MRIRLSSVYVTDQQRALDFYTKALGFVVKNDHQFGDSRWLTVVSPEGPGELELVLAPAQSEAVKTFQAALAKLGMPFTAFEVDDIEAEFARLGERGVEFTLEPTVAGEVTIAIFSDTCGNLIQLYQPGA